MRAIVWFTLLFVVAVVAATTLGSNDGLVSFYWSGWRTDVSLNLFLLALALTCFALVALVRAVDTLAGLPRRSREWRSARRDRIAQTALREALVQYFGGRWGRARKAAQQALASQPDPAGAAQDIDFTVLGHLLIAHCAHRMQDRTGRDEQLRKVFELVRGGTGHVAEEGARLLAAEWVLDDGDAARALGLLSELPPGVARRTHALRLKLQAARLACQPEEALRTARLLVHHQGFPAEAARGLVRSLVSEALDAAHDAGQVQELWQQLEPSERDDPCIAGPAARAAARLGAADVARRWLVPLWERLADFTSAERRVLAEALVVALDGISADWLTRLETVHRSLPGDGAAACAFGCALAAQGLWARAQPPLQQAAEDETLATGMRYRAWHLLGCLAGQQGDASRAAHCLEAAGRLAWGADVSACYTQGLRGCSSAG